MLSVFSLIALNPARQAKSTTKEDRSGRPHMRHPRAERPAGRLPGAARSVAIAVAIGVYGCVLRPATAGTDVRPESQV
jgi:hypothetical protein